MKKLIALPFLMLSIILLAACASTVHNMPDQPVPAAMTVKQVQKAVLVGAASQGWVTNVVQSGPRGGVVEATYTKGSQVATVSIPYTTAGYSIYHKASSDLDFDAVDNTIDGDYNTWINYLNQSIQSQLNLVAGGLAVHP